MLNQGLYYLLHVPLLGALALVLADGPVSIEQMEGYGSLRNCARNVCFEASLGGSRIGYELSCPSPLMNDCFCRPDLQVSATSYLSACVNSYCESNSIDVTRAVKIYTDYCASASQTRSSSRQTTTEDNQTPTHTAPTRSSSWETPAPTSMSEQNTPLTTPPAEPTSESSSSNNNMSPPAKEEDKLRGGEIAGIVVGILGFIATAAGVYFSYRMLKNKKQRRAASPEMASVY
ncbi:hypothetical protein MGYG_06601 [Nannizzia gypsea CBS 118893]|uniref:Extracellular membrane protein CFEM domain-containing protein n=1 Tax=Arthroderma gypseum (strain ATCC MYA-4604 / CBS 118893) TaxID=535722 RepID=E4V2P5_ARTGP|nr:hypothetical protein MGYG_06601 [Nannizzia gypsea CBS 118893]EFR03607.1 hypothetical protein MGYG_06601 [Nannizzia gypsea CBS 118893]